MIRQAQTKAKLQELIAAGNLPASTCGKGFLKVLNPLLAGGVLVWQRSGTGRQLVVKNAPALNAFCQQLFPDVPRSASMENRIAGVGQFRDSKAIAGLGNDIILLRTWCDDALLKNDNPIGAATATAAHGLFSFLLDADGNYELRGRCALVENPTVFMAFEKLGIDVATVIYGHGRISNRLLAWFAGLNTPDFHLLHLPDYDPVGLSEFQRMHSRLGGRVSLHFPTGLESLFVQFSNRKLLKKRNSQALLAKLRKSEVPDVRRIIELIDRYNAGLEQESLLLAPASVQFNHADS